LESLVARHCERIGELIAPIAESMGFALVRVRVFGGSRQVLQVMIERDDGSGVNVDDCADVSRAISPLLDVYDLISSSYRLEVSSPGIDRPLTRPVDFERFVGHQTKVELHTAAGGRKRFAGLLLGFDEVGVVRLSVEGEELAFALDAIESAKLVLTDALIEAYRPVE